MPNFFRLGLANAMLAASFFLPACTPQQNPSNSCIGAFPRACIGSLADISIEALRERSYNSKPVLIAQLGGPDMETEYDRHYSADGSPIHASFVAGYASDGLSVYARVDVPGTPMPSKGYPVVLFAHGWIGRDAAPGYDFSYNTTSLYGEIIDRYVDEGFVVVAPAYRGHGSVSGRNADGIEWLEAWDNGSHLSPTFYAIDVLNLLEGLVALNGAQWQTWGFETATSPRLDLDQVNLVAHSQGGDVALTVLAVTGEGSSVAQPIKAASIMAGNIADRCTQADTFGPLGSTIEAYMSGDGTWTGSATGRDGSVNPNFVFAWPQDWINTEYKDPTRWDWNPAHFPTHSVRQALIDRYTEMYGTLNDYAGDIQGASFRIGKDEKGRFFVTHPDAIKEPMLRIGGYHAVPYLTEPLALHYADKDYYSLADWNEELARRIVEAGGQAWAFRYTDNNHALKASKNTWFSPAGTPDGLPLVVARDRALFRDGNPPEGVQPEP